MPDDLLAAARQIFSLAKQISVPHGLWSCAPAGPSAEGTGTRFVGWALARHAALERVSIELDGTPLPLELGPPADANVFLRFEQHCIEQRGFSFVVPDLGWADREGVLTCRFGRAPPRPYQGYFLRSLDVEAPGVEHMRRTTGITDPAHFDFLGYTQLRHLEELHKAHAGPDARPPRRVLDWGCGAGRILRFACRRWPGEVCGADVDPVNVTWCHEKLGSRADIRILPLEPPMPFANASFDLVYGISVFTHLGENDQFAWLDELRRVTRPGGLVIVTIHGPTAFAKDVNDFWLCAKLASEGFLDLGASRDLDPGFPEVGQRYRNVFHTHRYVLDRWSEVLDVVEFIPGMSIAQQDYVVLRCPD